MSLTRSLRQLLSLSRPAPPRQSHYSTAPTQTPSPAQPAKFARFIRKPPPPRIPKPHHGIETVEAFLESLRRPSLLALANKFTEWDQLFSLEPKTQLVKDGTLSVPKERRYLLRCMELFRHGLDPKEFAVGVRKPKKFRGWGPRVQHGKRLRGKPAGRVTI
ncbi:hypothetical protein PTTG_25089 [Puccinia triticina 1-1 BBBD Race 1]|uniref:Small ribosomal subunit protein mS41 n=2 Tax=Puccinia triticina TaxID=208348 RepID=A0A180H5E8_PUCT1|nr:uncharacterized protein PtA15_9A350 [Puccinia triticina]OAV99888.1 hypothetical protein PTTG_25089 [Puccinia triticina 1-1 BBBD Race 1]WAQ88223.1 hypothetical protein PtA15_9A350 [Puccinia triticina]WAR60410.1 hypothetical protein PtB15_9B349 [Puccinia triticina]